MGRFWDLDVRRLNGKAFCRKCDWECFRDPSELFGPLLQVIRSPVKLARRMFLDPEYATVWREDLAYTMACDLFDGRRAPNMGKLARFAASPADHEHTPLPTQARHPDGEVFRARALTT